MVKDCQGGLKIKLHNLLSTSDVSQCEGLLKKVKILSILANVVVPSIYLLIIIILRFSGLPQSPVSSSSKVFLTVIFFFLALLNFLIYPFLKKFFLNASKIRDDFRKREETYEKRGIKPAKGGFGDTSEITEMLFARTIVLYTLVHLPAVYGLLLGVLGATIPFLALIAISLFQFYFLFYRPLVIDEGIMELCSQLNVE